MKFEIDFNYPNDSKNTPEFFEQIEAKIEYYDDYSNWAIEIKDFEEMKKLWFKIVELLGYEYSWIVDFELGHIYLDNTV